MVKVGTLLLYALNFGFPTLLGLAGLALSFNYAYKWRPQEQQRDLITLAIPWFFTFIALELLVSYVTGKKYYRLNDAVNSVFMGTFQQVTGSFVKSVGIVPYVWIYENYALVRFEQVDWLLWIGI
jgi:hypothetical protein